MREPRPQAGQLRALPQVPAWAPGIVRPTPPPRCSAAVQRSPSSARHAEPWAEELERLLAAREARPAGIAGPEDGKGHASGVDRVTARTPVLSGEASKTGSLGSGLGSSDGLAPS